MDVQVDNVVRAIRLVRVTEGIGVIRIIFPITTMPKNRGRKDSEERGSWLSITFVIECSEYIFRRHLLGMHAAQKKMGY